MFIVSVKLSYVRSVRAFTHQRNRGETEETDGKMDDKKILRCQRRFVLSYQNSYIFSLNNYQRYDAGRLLSTRKEHEMKHMHGNGTISPSCN